MEKTSEMGALMFGMVFVTGSLIGAFETAYYIEGLLCFILSVLIEISQKLPNFQEAQTTIKVEVEEHG